MWLAAMKSKHLPSSITSNSNKLQSLQVSQLHTAIFWNALHLYTFILFLYCDESVQHCNLNLLSLVIFIVWISLGKINLNLQLGYVGVVFITLESLNNEIEYNLNIPNISATNFLMFHLLIWWKLKCLVIIQSYQMLVLTTSYSELVE